MPKRKRKTVSDRYLSILWRQAVLKVWKCCVVCGNLNQAELECHHFVHRKIKLLRWDWRNGFPVCNSLTKNACHSKADMIQGRSFIEAKMGERNLNYLREREGIVHKDWLRENGLSENEWRLQIKEELKRIINESA